MTRKNKAYGYELILDLHGCDVTKFNRTSLRKYFTKICKAIDMKRCELYFWDDYRVPDRERQTSPYTKGTSAVQFILTSTIVIHTLDLMNAAYINIFSCKSFDKKIAARITREWFAAKKYKAYFIERI